MIIIPRIHTFFFFFFLMIRRPPRSTLSSSSAASDVYKRQVSTQSTGTSDNGDMKRNRVLAGVWTSFRGRLGAKTQLRCLMLGLDASGKSTMLYNTLKNGWGSPLPRQIGFNVEEIDLQCSSSGTQYHLVLWDVAGQEKMRPLWIHYYHSTNRLIWVVDSNDSGRMAESRDELWNVLADDEMENVPVLVIANKQDLPGAMSADEVSDGLGLFRLNDRPWHIVAGCATTSEGISEGLDWVLKAQQLLRVVPAAAWSPEMGYSRRCSKFCCQIVATALCAEAGVLVPFHASHPLFVVLVAVMADCDRCQALAYNEVKGESDHCGCQSPMCMRGIKKYHGASNVPDTPEIQGPTPRCRPDHCSCVVS
eukprot:TRINITY_DN16771_c0_g1_i1.p1 TRINITY_DN16771_c0_g1~~TRINITY_DN16771_c0_g1_i1.p1  ORF type:complete len:364 (+),score=74.47 TRINITY_DN16771_c0_g1_i1:93-1184(+)